MQQQSALQGGVQQMSALVEMQRQPSGT